MHPDTPYTLQTLTAYGKTWPLVREPRLAVSIRHTSPTSSELPIEEQIRILEFTYARMFAAHDDLAIEILPQHVLRLGPEDQAERDRLRRERGSADESDTHETT